MGLFPTGLGEIASFRHDPQIEIWRIPPVFAKEESEEWEEKELRDFFFSISCREA